MWLYLPSEVCPSALAPKDSDSVSISRSASDTALWVTSSGTPTQRPPSWRGWKTRPWRRLLSGTTCRPSTADRGVEQWTSSLRASHASPSPTPANEGVPTMIAGSGLSSLTLFAVWDRDSSSWRTSRPSFDLCGDNRHLSVPSSQTWPSSGSMRSGKCYRRPTAAPRISASESSSWPTATGQDATSSGGNPDTTGTHGVTLTDRVVRMWPTPCAQEDQKSPEAHMAMKKRMPGGPRTEPTSLTVVAKMWPTPAAADSERNSNHFKRGPGNPTLLGKARAWPTPMARDTHPLPSAETASARWERGTRNLDDAVSLHYGLPDLTTRTDGADCSKRTRVLNPRFVEMLMGWPVGWTDCESSATESFRSWQERHSSALLAVLGCSEEVA